MRSDTVKRGVERAPRRSLFKVTRAMHGDLGKSVGGACTSDLDLIPGHVHLHEGGQVAEAGGVPFVFR